MGKQFFNNVLIFIIGCVSRLPFLPSALRLSTRMQLEKLADYNKSVKPLEFYFFYKGKQTTCTVLDKDIGGSYVYEVYLNGRLTGKIWPYESGVWHQVEGEFLDDDTIEIIHHKIEEHYG
jgi:hypothetical protein